MRRIHQFLAGFRTSDAISNEAMAMRQLFRSWGCGSEIFCEGRRVSPEMRAQTRDVADYAAQQRPDDVVLLHLSIGTVVNDAFAHLRCRKAVLYHNITPPHYFDAFNRQTACDLRRGLEQTRQLAGAAQVNLADSRFNACELERLGYRDVRVFPLFLDFDLLLSAPDRSLTRKLGDGRTLILFVGRCAPNKRIEDALTAFAFYSRFVEPGARFAHVGSFAGVERYYHWLVARVRDLGVENVEFAGAVAQAQLMAYYASAHLFLCMSEHEGFCIPLVESMLHEVPVLAYAAGAVPETLDGAGVLCREKRYEFVAEMMKRLIHDPPFRSAVLAGQRERIGRYRARDLASELRDHLAPLLT